MHQDYQNHSYSCCDIPITGYDKQLGKDHVQVGFHGDIYGNPITGICVNALLLKFCITVGKPVHWFLPLCLQQFSILHTAGQGLSFPTFEQKIYISICLQKQNLIFS